VAFQSAVTRQQGGDYIPVSDYIKRLLLDTLASNINEVILGFDGTPATSDDGSAGRPAITLTPTVTIVDDTSLLVEATLPYTESFTDKIREVYIQFRDTTEFTPVARYTINPVTKNNSNELLIQIAIEVA
tara:strand:- start:260 stop:649 length:390 start_codon:yes stop_codon:yes gene_type:complete